MAIVYYLPGYYPNKTAAGTAYTAIEQIIHDVDYDLLAYRLMRPRDKQWLVVVISQQHTWQQQARVTNSTVAQIPHQVVLSRLVDPGVRIWSLAGGLDGVVDNDRIGGLAGLDGDLIATDSIVRDQIPGARIKDSVNAIGRARGDLIVVDEGRSGPKEGDAIGVILQDVRGDHIGARACLDKDALVSVGDVVVGQRGLAYKLYHGQIPIGACKTLA